MTRVRSILLLCALSGGLAWPVLAADVSEQLIALERKAWEAWQTGDQKAYADLTAEPAVKVSGGGIVAGKKDFVSVEIPEGCTDRGYALDSFVAHKITDAVYALTYAAQLKQTCDGGPEDHSLYSTSIWSNVDGKWKNVLLAEADVYEPGDLDTDTVSKSDAESRTEQ
jgi:hypothetical protein